MHQVPAKLGGMSFPRPAPSDEGMYLIAPRSNQAGKRIDYDLSVGGYIWRVCVHQWKSACLGSHDSGVSTGRCLAHA